MATDYTTITKEYTEGNADNQQATRAANEHNARVPFPNFLRYVIIESIFDPTLIDQRKLDYWEHQLGVTNIKYATVAPRNAIIAQRVLGPSATPLEAPMILYPFFPPTIAMPCNPGEHVWVMFEDSQGTLNDLGYWMNRIVSPSFVEDVNHTHAPREHDASFLPGVKDQFDGTLSPSYEFRNGKVGNDDGERYTMAESTMVPGGEDIYKSLMQDSDGGRLQTYEPVPRYRKRPDEFVLEGTNNTLIVLGRDRNGNVAIYDDDESRGGLPSIPQVDSQGPENGMLDIVAGRGQTSRTGGSVVDNDIQSSEIGKSTNELVTDEGDPDLLNDRSRIRLSQRTNIDINLSLDSFNANLGAGPFDGTASNVNDVTDSPNGDGAIIIKTDKTRLVSRSDVEILVTTYERDETGRMIAITDESKWSAIIIKPNGDIVFKPADQAYIKLGGDDANKAIVCTDLPAQAVDGQVTASPLITTMGGQFAGGTNPGQGTYSKKVLIK